MVKVGVEDEGADKSEMTQTRMLMIDDNDDKEDADDLQWSMVMTKIMTVINEDGDSDSDSETA